MRVGGTVLAALLAGCGCELDPTVGVLVSTDRGETVEFDFDAAAAGALPCQMVVTTRGAVFATCGDRLVVSDRGGCDWIEVVPLDGSSPFVPSALTPGARDAVLGIIANRLVGVGADGSSSVLRLPVWDTPLEGPSRAAVEGNTFSVVGGQAYYRSIDGGENWEERSFDVLAAAVAIAGDQPDRAAKLERVAEGYRVWTTTNGGRDWSTHGEVGPLTTGVPLLVFPPQSADVVWVLSDGLYRAALPDGSLQRVTAADPPAGQALSLRVLVPHPGDHDEVAVLWTSEGGRALAFVDQRRSEPEVVELVGDVDPLGVAWDQRRRDRIYLAVDPDP